MLKGTIDVMTDLNRVMERLYTFDGNTKVILLQDQPDPSVVSQCRGVVGSILLPPYECFSLKLNDDPNFAPAYFNYLSTGDTFDFLLVIIRALYNGTNLILYTSKGEYQNFFPEFSAFMLSTFGVLIGEPEKYTAYGFDINYTPFICNNLYMYGYMNFEEYMINYPKDPRYGIPQQVIFKMVEEVNPYVKEPSIEAYAKYFMDYKTAIGNYNRLLEIPLRRVNQC